MNPPAEAVAVKSCCAALYESDLARILLGSSFHPGGLGLTRRLGEQLMLGRGLRVLDVASGKGESAIHLAGQFGCAVVGVDFGAGNVEEARARAATAGVGELVTFEEGDAEELHFADASFDAVICECAFCTFSGKQRAAGEFRRVLRPGCGIGISDLTRPAGPVAALPAELEGLLAWIACIGDARPVADYQAYLVEAGFAVTLVEQHDGALADMARDIQGRLLGAELMVKLKKLDLPGADFEAARKMARAALTAIQQGLLGYSLLVGRAPAEGIVCS